MNPLNETPSPLDHLALRGARGAVAIEDREGVLDHAALEAMTGALAAALAARVAAGGRVASWLAKSRLACVLPLACARAGLVHVPANPLLRRAQVAHILADSGAALLIAGDARAETLAAGDVPAACAVVREAAGAGWLAGAGLPPSAADPGALAAILYTSGSSGAPKGVMLSHANLWLGAVAVARYLDLAADDVVLAVLPLSFDYGQNQLLAAWAAGARVVPFDHALPGDVAKACARHRVTTLAAVPPLWVQLAEARWPAEATRLRRLTSSGGRLPVPLGRRLRALFPDAALHSMYGLTEAFRSTALDPALYDANPGSIGRAIPFAEVLVVRADGSVTDDGEPGELVHAGPLVARGYWRDPVRTAARFRPAPPASRYGGTAVWSGDTVVREAGGLLRFVGRADAMMKVSGHRVSPTEVEEAALASGEAAEALAFGVGDARSGEAIRLAVAGAGDDAALVAHLRRELPGFMQPQAVRRLAALPRTPNGKVDRAAVVAGWEAAP